MKSEHRGRVGVHAVGGIVHDALEWIFREHPTSDHGIDGHIEICSPRPTGRLLAVQIKSGDSFFTESNGEGWVYRGTERHLDYWLRHDLPVILVLRSTATKNVYWVAVVREAVTRTGEGWKITVPRHQTLDADSKAALEELTKSTLYSQRLTALAIAREWIQIPDPDKHIELVLEAEEWINKSSGRGSLTLKRVDGWTMEEAPVSEWPFVLLPGQAYEHLLPQLFPWADLFIDDHYYEDFDRDRFNQSHCHFDRESGQYLSRGFSFSDWRRRQPQIRPYAVHSMEVAHFRLILKVNELGRSFLLVDSFLSTGELPSTPRGGRSSDGYRHGLKSVVANVTGSKSIANDPSGPSEE